MTRSLSFRRSIPVFPVWGVAKYHNTYIPLLCANLNIYLTLPKSELYTRNSHRDFERHFSTTAKLMLPTNSDRGASRRDRSRNPDVVISKALSFTLRHGAVKEGLSIRPDGYVSVADLVSFLFPNTSAKGK